MHGWLGHLNLQDWFVISFMQILQHKEHNTGQLTIHKIKTTGMKNKMNRRQWLRNTAILSGGFTIIPGFINHAGAETISVRKWHRHFDDRQFVFDNDIVVPKLRARLFANENPFGPSEAAKKAIAEAIDESYRYPINSVTDLEKKIIEAEGLKEGQLMLSSGSSPLLRASAVYFSKPGANIVTAAPTYEDIPEHCAGLNMKVNFVPLNDKHEYDLDAMEKAVDGNTTLVYVCNPNNPTGTMVDGDKLRGFCERVSKKATVFVDEAYMDYVKDPVGSSMVDCVRKGMNVIVARTFSKLYGFAGLRVGYIMAQEPLIKAYENYTAGPWCLSDPSVAGALVAYKDQSYLSGALKKTMESKDYLYKVLKEEGYDYIPSHTNFVMFPVKMDGEKFMTEMMKRGVGVRFWQFENKQWCRVSIGRMDEMQAFAEAFKEIS
jgi:histidinol-phosphate aminotransferase